MGQSPLIMVCNIRMLGAVQRIKLDLDIIKPNLEIYYSCDSVLGEDFMQDLMVLCLTRRILGTVVTIFLSLGLFLACLMCA